MRDNPIIRLARTEEAIELAETMFENKDETLSENQINTTLLLRHILKNQETLLHMLNRVKHQL